MNDVICYYAFIFDLGIQTVLTFPIHDLEEMAYTKIAIENWKNSE
nr:MAG TPA: hypothetical protein [Caudoviricetes sp.]